MPRRDRVSALSVISEAVLIESQLDRL